MAPATRTTAAAKRSAKTPVKPVSKTGTAARAANAKKASTEKTTGARRTRRAATTTTAKATPAKRTRAAKPAPAAPARREQTRRSHAEKIKLGKTIISRMKKGEKMIEIASDLKLYPFQAHQLVALVHVDNGDVSKIEAKSEDVLVKRIAAERAKGNEASSWDYLQARTGINKVKIKKMLEDAGYDTGDVRASRAERKSAKPAARRTAAAKARTATRAKAEPAATRTTRRTASPPATATGSKRAKAAPAPAPVSARKERKNRAEVQRVGRTAAAQTPKGKLPAKSARKLSGAAKVSAEHKTSAGRKPAAPKRTRRPVNVPRGARPTPDPS